MKWLVNFKILLMFIFGWLPMAIVSYVLWIFAVIHEKLTAKLNKFGAYLVMYKMTNDPPDLNKIIGKMFK